MTTLNAKQQDLYDRSREFGPIAVRKGEIRTARALERRGLGQTTPTQGRQTYNYRDQGVAVSTTAAYDGEYFVADNWTFNQHTGCWEKKKRSVRRVHSSAKMDALAVVAKQTLGVPTLDERGSDDADFHTLGVWELRKALLAAYELGRAADKQSEQEQFVNDMHEARNAMAIEMAFADDE